MPRTLSLEEPLPHQSMAENACAACHVSHGATQPERLLRARSYDLCIECHSGITATDVLSVMGLASGHKPNRLRDEHDPEEDPRTMRPHVECVDCHNPHAVRGDPLRDTTLAAPLGAPRLPAEMQIVPGVTLFGVPIETARNYYEVCFRCHADNPVPIRRRIVRNRDEIGNIRRQFLPTAASAHPVTFALRNPAEVPSLTPAARTRPTMGCEDCHNNADARALGGAGPNGPHGSRFRFILARQYETADFTAESPQAYALCYECHDRNSILGDESFSLHRIHIVRGRSPCSACHSPHGVNGSRAEHDHLINFDLSIVQGQRQYIDTGQFSGRCTLTCHGVQHVNFEYSR